MTKSGTTLIELMFVIVIASMIMIPTIDFLISSQRTATKGFGKLETLETTRFILEKVQRDLKVLCSEPGHGFMPISTTTYSFTFPVFPSGTGYVGDDIPVNIVSYIFDPAKMTLTRTIKIHPLLAAPAQSFFSKIVATNVASFSICPKEMLSMRYYDIQVLCQSNNPASKQVQIFLRAAVRSDYEARLGRSPFLVTNRRTKLSYPP
ncbi:MAG: hypothetical protein HQM09_02965 [Candidatus Riflebacteria bacterium]|nr:hypothetical protein [Candidatus Riflebacteria bacterium]